VGLTVKDKKTPQFLTKKASHKSKGDFIFKNLAAIMAASALVLLFIIGYELASGSSTVIKAFGTDFFVGSNWIPNEGKEFYGALPYLLGTLATSGIALLIAVPLSIGIAVFLVEMSPRVLRVPISYLVELLAAVPSVIFGLWGLFVFRHTLTTYIAVPLNTYLGWIPIFSGNPMGLDLFTASVVLAEPVAERRRHRLVDEAHARDVERVEDSLQLGTVGLEGRDG
jgi:phosphate transport system permease protein